MLQRIQRWSLLAFAVALPVGQSPAEITLGIGVVAWVLRGLKGQRRPFLTRNPLNFLLAAWFLVAVASMINSVDLAASLQGLRKLAKVFALYFLILDTVGSWASLRPLLVACLSGLSLMILDGLWQAVFGKDFLSGNPLSESLGGAVRRVQATFNHPGNLSIYLASVAPLAMALGLQGAARRRWWLIGLMSLTVVVVVLNRSRAGFIAFLLSLVLVGWWLRRWLPVALAALAALLQAITVPPAVKAWAATMPSWWEQLAQPDRVSYWQVAINMFKAHPIIGVGTNTFTKNYAIYCDPGDPFAHVGPYAHNQYFHLAAELGSLGVLVFCGVLVVVFRSLGRSLDGRVHTPGDVAVSAGLGAGLIGYLFVGGFESSLFHARGALIFWFLAGLIIATSREARRA